MDSNKRIQVLTRQLTIASISGAQPESISASAIDVQRLAAFLEHDNPELRSQIKEFLKDDIFRPNHYISLMEFRELTLQRLKKFVAQRFFSVRDYLNDPRRFMAALEVLSFCDYSMAIKSGVHFTLCGGTICKLGTAKHHDTLLPRIDSLDLPGCFGMTELGHGSNVMGIETTAVYDKAAGEFVINTPNDAASKAWIGGAAQHGKVCTVFAQLTINGKWEGPHVFVVRIRDDNANIMPGVRIQDHGPKMGLNGVDNGRIWFHNVRVQRDALLDAFASVDAQGNYSSSIPTVSKRFGTMVGGLTTGRMLIAQGAIDGCKTGVTIAIRYSAARPQFGDKLILEYLTQQRRLMPGLASTYAHHLAMASLKDVFCRKRPEDAKLIHVLSSGLKAAATWTRVEVLQNCRECCGGMGFLAANRIGPMKTDMDVDVTFEGDNTVLMQQVANAVLEDRALVSSPHSSMRMALTSGICAQRLLALLAWREKELACQLAAQMAAAAKAAGGQKQAAAAAQKVFDDNLDTVVALGWANVDKTCMEIFLSRNQQAPPQLQPALNLLARLYAATRVERDLATFLAAGVLTREDSQALRLAVNQMCSTLAANKGELALKLCSGFAIPDHLLAAPIAFDWERI